MTVSREDHAILYDGGEVPPRVVAISIVAYWTFYLLVATIRLLIEQEDGQALLFLARVAVTMASAIATVALYLALHRVKGRSIAGDVAWAMVLAIPAAAVYGCASWLMFDHAMPALRVVTGGGAGAVVVGGPGASGRISPPARVIEGALNGFFFFVGWSALYLSLSHAWRIQALEKVAARLRASAQAAELRALRYQVNPHFLFNALNSLSALVLKGDNAAAERMIGALAGFMRASLSDDPTHEVTLGEEIELQRLYLDIETQRFRERLRAIVDLPPVFATALVPGLILQPLVENAVKHGVARSRRPVTIRIVADGAMDRLFVSVTNDGVERAPGALGHGLGLANVRDRLAGRYGSEGRLRCGYIPDGGFAAVIDMPLVLRADD